MVELDNEMKGENSLFANQSPIFDKLKAQATQDVFDVTYPKKGIFNKVHTIDEAIQKFEKENIGKPMSRKAEFNTMVKSSSAQKISADDD